MKHLKHVLLLTLVLCLCLPLVAACGGGDTKTYSFRYGSATLTPGTPAKDALTALGEPLSFSESGSCGGIPGTDSNNETTYQYQTGTDTESSSTSKLEDFLPNESLSVQNLPAGVINYGNSSLSLTAISYRVIKEEDAKSQGLLDGITWDQYKAANDAYTKMDVDQDFYSLVSTATGIPAEAITIMAYEVPQFIDKEGASEEQISIAVSVILVLLILAILAFVIIRSMMAGKEVQKEEELSVESLLQSTPDETVEDIELESKSETRKMIEKFVDENPEAAANLLRNWLNEDWG